MRSTRRETSRSESTSRPESISSRIGELRLQHRELHRLGALLLTAGELVVHTAGQELVADAERGRLAEHRVVEAGRVDVAGAHRSGDERLERHAGHLHRILHREEQPALRALPRGQTDQLFAVDRDRPGGHFVVGSPHQRVRQRRLARTVRAHQRVHFAGTNFEIHAVQDLVAGDT